MLYSTVIFKQNYNMKIFHTIIFSLGENIIANCANNE